MTHHPLTLAALLLAAPLANAAMLRCADAQGRLTFSNIACPPATERSVIDPLRWLRERWPAVRLMRVDFPTAAGSASAAQSSWTMWQGSWGAASEIARAHCVKRHPFDYALQGGCMRNAERGFNDLGTDHGLPPSVAEQVKARCAQRHPDDFALQAGCLRNQARGYQTTH